MTRILIDGIHLEQEMKGVGRYVANVLWQFLTLKIDYEYWVVVRQEAKLPPLPQDQRFHYVRVKWRNHFVHGLWRLPRLADRLHVQLTWIPYETTLGTFSRSFLVLCHDVPTDIMEAQVEGGGPHSPVRNLIAWADTKLMRWALHRASLTFCNSEFVGRWLQSDVGLSPARIRLAPCAPGADFATLSATLDPSQVRKNLGCQAGYVLIFATGDQRENHLAAFRVFDRLAAHMPALQLVIAGVRENFKISVQQALDSYTWRDRVKLLPFYGQDDLMKLVASYAGASVYLDLSLHEGFGMQVVEAMACGIPVVCSNRGALPEVTGGAAALVDPEDENKVANTIGELLKENENRSRMILHGRERAAQFSWSRTASVILDGIRDVLH